MSVKSRFNPTGVALIFLGVMLGLTLIAAGVGVGMMRAASVVDRPPQTTAVEAARQVPPPPRLQVDRLADRAVDVAPDSQASTYGWTDRAAGRAHVPVEAAMRLLAARGWPDAEAGR